MRRIPLLRYSTGLGKITCFLILAVTLIASCSLGGQDTSGRSRPADQVTGQSPGVAKAGATVKEVASVGKPLDARPNVVLITIDSFRADHVGSYGNPRVKTPNLDALARQGVRFSKTISQFSQTNPSHASFFTGTYPATHKLKHHGAEKLSESVTPLAEVLAGNGFYTAGIHSWPTFDPEYSGLERGFKTYRGVYFEAWPQYQDPWRSRDGRADVTTNAVLKWLGERPPGPFFLWVHYQDPHYPYLAPAPFNTMYAPGCQECLDGGWETHDKIVSGESLSQEEISRVVALYDGEISFMDQEIGRLLDEMRRGKILDDTLVIVTADHGESFAENGRWFHPWILYNTVLRIPLIMSYPPSISGGRVVDAITQSVDVMPTILELLGISPPKQTEGTSLWPLILGGEKGDDRIAFAQVLDDSYLAAVTAEWKLIRNNDTGELELYSMKTDPGELNNLASANPQQALELEAKMKAWMAKHGITPKR